MTEEHVVALCTKYPKMIRDRGKHKNSPINLFGFECGDGWYHLLDSLMGNIQSYLDWKNREEEVVKQVVLLQVKEKFGGLRFYFDGGDSYILGLASLAESVSTHTCETCGNLAKTRSGGWVRTLCDLHEEEYQAARVR